MRKGWAVTVRSHSWVLEFELAVGRDFPLFVLVRIEENNASLQRVPDNSFGRHTMRPGPYVLMYVVHIIG